MPSCQIRGTGQRSGSGTPRGVSEKRDGIIRRSNNTPKRGIGSISSHRFSRCINVWVKPFFTGEFINCWGRSWSEAGRRLKREGKMASEREACEEDLLDILGKVRQASELGTNGWKKLPRGRQATRKDQWSNKEKSKSTLISTWEAGILVQDSRVGIVADSWINVGTAFPRELPVKACYCFRSWFI